MALSPPNVTGSEPLPRGVVLAVLVFALALGWGWRVTRLSDPGGAEVASAVMRVDVNSADADTLELLPGIGPSIAEAIVDRREDHGRFGSPEELEAVRMIGPVLRERMTPWVEFGHGSAAVTPATAASPDDGSAAPR